MSALRTLAVLLVVLGLAVLEIVGGLSQIDRLRSQRRDELIALVERDLDRTALTVSVLMERGLEPTSPEVASLVAGFAPLPGVAARLGPAGTAPSADGDPAADRLYTAPLASAPGWTLSARLPRDALDAAVESAGGVSSWIIFSMVAALLVLALVGAVVLRLSQRTFRLQETERYLRWIRRVTDRYRALMEGAADLILILSPASGAIREANAVARETLGLPGGEFPEPEDGEPAGGTLQPMLVPPSEERFTAALERAVAGAPVAERGLQLRTRDGGVLTVDAQLALIDLGDERVVELSLRDVTHQRDMERQLQTSERLASLGLLTAGVAHEINNPLEGVGNYLSLLGREDLEADKRSRYLDQARRGFDRIRDIVSDLLSFARPSMESSRADLAEVVTGALGLAGFASEFHDIRVQHSGLEAPLPVAGDPRRLEQVVLNLLLNASQSMGGKGTVRITGEQVRREDGSRWARLSVADDGPGIPPEDLDRLFDPFFSGRGERADGAGRSTGGGTGLGLSVSFGIISAHGGTLAARNLPAGGAEFIITLPVDGPSPDSPGGSGP